MRLDLDCVRNILLTHESQLGQNEMVDAADLSALKPLSK